MAEDHSPPASTEKKVLFVTPVAPWGIFGGTPIASRNLIEIFSEAIGNLQVCCLRSDTPGNYPQTVHGATVLTGGVSGLVRKLKFFLDFSADSFAHRQFQKAAVRARFAALLAEQRPDVVVFDHIYSTWLIDLVQEPQTRVAYIAHDDMVAFLDSLRDFQPSFSKRLRFAGLRRQCQPSQQKVLRRCDYVLTLTPEDAQRLQGDTRGVVEIAPIFFEFPSFTREYPAEFRYLLITGSFDTWEKQTGLLRFFSSVFPALLEKHPDFQVVLAGRIGEALLQQIPFHEPQLRIVQAPSNEEMQELMRKASAAVVLDLQASGLKIKTMELAAAGLPLVSWPPGVEGTQLAPDESCFRAETSAEFVTHLSTLYTGAELRQRMGAAARAIVQAAFSREAALTRLRNSKLFSALSETDAASAASR